MGSIGETGAVVDDVGGAPTDFIPFVLQPLTGSVLGGVVTQGARHGGDRGRDPLSRHGAVIETDWQSDL